MGWEGYKVSRVTVGVDKGYDTTGFVATLRRMSATPHFVQNDTKGRKKMKTTKELTKKATLILTCATLMFLTFGAWPVFAVGETQQASEAVWGKPVVIQKLDNGLEKRFNKIDNSMKIGDRMFLFKDGKAVGTTIASFQALQSGGKSYETALESANAVESIAIANQWKGSEKEIKSFVNSQEVVFQFPGGNVKKISLPEEKMMVAIAPYKKETHPCATHYFSSCQAELVQQTFLVSAVDQEGNILVDQPMTTLRNGFFELWLPRNRTIMLSVRGGDLKAEGQIDTFSNSLTCVTTLQLQ